MLHIRTPAVHDDADNMARKILNDPVYGFVTLRGELLLKLIDHPWFQRLRRISQLGLSHLVYPGATHNRFHHAVGAMHLMQSAIEELRQKGHNISEDEREAACAAILLHDIGHGPFSHALEHTLVKGISHEAISLLIMERLNDQLNGALDRAIAIFQGKYHKKFLHGLVSSQLDMDRLDYLRRDSFYSGVTEGKVGSSRIIKMLDVHNDELVVEEKGIYSIEKFIVARRLMYWQVYLHKTVLSAEFMLVNVLRRAKERVSNGHTLFASPALARFLSCDCTGDDFLKDPHVLNDFCRLDDYDILGAIKVWQEDSDPVLSDLCQRLVQRKLFKIELRRDAFSQEEIATAMQTVRRELGLDASDAAYYIISEKIDNRAYDKTSSMIGIKFKDGKVLDVAEASDHLNLSALSEAVEKHFLCYPNEVRSAKA